VEILCSGILPAEKGVRPCTKKINVEPNQRYAENGLQLSWLEPGNQGHNCYFCSWNCLKGFIENSQWLKEESK
jgi:hypothetical protein